MHAQNQNHVGEQSQLTLSIAFDQILPRTDICMTFYNMKTTCRLTFYNFPTFFDITPGLPGEHPLLDVLEEGGVELVERVDVGEQEGDRLLGHVLLFGHLVPEPLGVKQYKLYKRNDLLRKAKLFMTEMNIIYIIYT